ncbi:MAG: PsiF family protein [Betaproteobacteria bacterium]
MKSLIAAACLSLAFSPLAFAQDKKDAKKEPGAAQKKQQERMKDCNEKVGERKGDERKKFMSACLKGEMDKPAAAAKGAAQQERMKSCNQQASKKGMKGDDRKKCMSDCLKG